MRQRQLLSFFACPELDRSPNARTQLILTTRTRLSPISHRVLSAARLAALDRLAESGRAVFTLTDSP